MLSVAMFPHVHDLRLHTCPCPHSGAIGKISVYVRVRDSLTDLANLVRRQFVEGVGGLMSPVSGPLLSLAVHRLAYTTTCTRRVDLHPTVWYLLFVYVRSPLLSRNDYLQDC